MKTLLIFVIATSFNLFESRPIERETLPMFSGFEFKGQVNTDEYFAIICGQVWGTCWCCTDSTGGGSACYIDSNGCKDDTQ
jgi:hypothetical protein